MSLNQISFDEKIIEDELVNEDVVYSSIWFVTQNDFVDINNKKWLFLNEIVSRIPIYYWTNKEQQLDPNLDRGEPLFVINRRYLDTEPVMSVLNSAISFYKILHHGYSLLADVEATQQIADLNIDRLHRTLRELEVERDKSLVANKAKQSFLASVTHELRTPLTAILGFIEILESSELDDEQKNNVHAISSASKILLSLINDVLNFSKIEEGKLSIHKEPYSLKESVDETFEMLRFKAEGKGLEYNLDWSEDIEELVHGDKLRLNQILTNLLNNAIKFTEDGAVSLSVKRVFDNNYSFQVCDTGIGIAEDKIDKIFDSFTQADERVTHTHGGTGLGLSIVKKIVHLLGGELDVKSQSGKGTTFSIQLNLPPAVNEDLSKKEAILDYELLGKLNVLVVEDNHLNQLLIQKLLTPVVNTIIICGDGESAINTTAKRKFDVILMDLNLPDMNGLEIIQEIQRADMNKLTPCAVISANIWEEQLNKIKNAGIDIFIQKPFSREDLLVKMTKLYKQGVQESGEIDLSYLREISDNDDTFIAEVLSKFITNSQVDFDLLKDDFNSGNHENVAKIAHKLKSSFRMLNAKRASSICQELEDDQESQSVDQINRLEASIRELQGIASAYLDATRF